MLIKEGDYVRVKNTKCRLCDCGCPFINKIGVVKNIVYDNEVGMCYYLHLVFENKKGCSGFYLEDIEKVDKPIKQFGIVEFMKKTS